MSSRPALPQRTKVLYVAGSARSGSTLLARVLGELDGTFAAGELRLLWERSLLEGAPCGCGSPFERCPVWQDVLSSAFGDRIPDARWMRAHQPRTRHLPLMLAAGGDRLLQSLFRRQIEVLDALYRAIPATTGCSLIVDSSKSPLYGYLLSLLPSVDLYVLHLVRDPRGSQYSRIRRARSGHARRRRYNVLRGSVYWNLTNLTQELLGRRLPRPALRLRYEDFVGDPERVLERVTGYLHEGSRPAPALDDGTVVLGRHHTIAGSESLLDSGVVTLRLDERWRASLDRRSRAVVTALTWPLLARYRYQR